MKYIWICIICIAVIGIAAILYRQAVTQSTYEGLPTVPCLDYTKPVVQAFSFTLSITINNKPYPLNPGIGHDYGNCLHDIFVNDASGKVYVKANDNEQFTLGQFFDVWHKTFSQEQIFTYQKAQNYTIRVYVNDKEVNTFRTTPLRKNSVIRIICNS